MRGGFAISPEKAQQTAQQSHALSSVSTMRGRHAHLGRQLSEQAAYWDGVLYTVRAASQLYCLTPTLRPHATHLDTPGSRREAPRDSAQFADAPEMHRHMGRREKGEGRGASFDFDMAP